MKKKGSITPYIKLRDELSDSSSSSMTASNCIRGRNLSGRNLSSLDLNSQDQVSASRASNNDEYFADLQKNLLIRQGMKARVRRFPGMVFL
mmetsp:Transcript_9494/g.20155  ORF Transcript_9494/g.20155 Transcript_9494/m.20155 type:complete len:91 (+) Transcript_9494:408-680(+)